jgi:hypothetical protein
MNVLIVGRTKMGETHRCIGGLADDGTSLRLLDDDGSNWDTSVPLQIGEIWDLDYKPAVAPVAPHVEDVLVEGGKYLGVQQDLRVHLLGRVQPWQGSITAIFDGRVGYTSNNNGYIAARRGLPAQSTGYWIPDQDLVLRADGRHYDYVGRFGNRGLSYVGEQTPLDLIPANTLVRVSLARWWKPDDAGDDFEERCYLQLSGCFT